MHFVTQIFLNVHNIATYESRFKYTTRDAVVMFAIRAEREMIALIAEMHVVGSVLFRSTVSNMEQASCVL